ncbi:MAG: DUF4230 domain-containing protein [Fibrobacteres bacterium]|nr:DUF4230 domain-containing protein [Fibrobacterota bacterium]
MLLCAGGGAWYFLDRIRPEKVGRALSEALAQSLGLSPSVTLRDWVVVEEKKPLAELALVSRDADVSHRIESVRLRSKAELSLRAVFRIKAGFDLRDPDTRFALEPGLRKAYFELPLPRVLSADMIRYEVLTDREGWWNRIGEAEKSQAMADLRTEALAETMRAGLLRECESRLEEELAGVSRRTGVEIAVRYRGSLANADSLKASSNSPMLP